MVRDLRYALRVLMQNRAVTIMAVLALALGIGANTAIFSVVHAVLLTPLPYHDPGRLVTVLGHGSNPVSPADFRDVRKQARSFERVGAAELWSASLTGRDAPEEIVGQHFSEDMFPLLGVVPLRGRTFDAGDFGPARIAWSCSDTPCGSGASGRSRRSSARRSCSTVNATQSSASCLLSFTSPLSG